MAYSKLVKFEQAQAEAEAQRKELEARRDIKRLVKEALPASVRKAARIPKRPKGRTAVGGVTRAEVAQLRREANDFLADDEGLKALRAKIQREALVILLIDGVMGTEPWRVAGGPHGALVAANARVRFLENAARILDDLERSKGSTQNRLTAGVVQDAQYTADPQPEPDGGV